MVKKLIKNPTIASAMLLNLFEKHRIWRRAYDDPTRQQFNDVSDAINAWYLAGTARPHANILQNKVTKELEKLEKLVAWAILSD